MPRLRRATRPRQRRINDLLGRVLFWAATAKTQMEAKPEGPEWIISLAEALFILGKLENERTARDRAADIAPLGTALLNAIDDLRVGRLPVWMVPAALPPSRRPPSKRNILIRGCAVDCALTLVQTFDYSERRAATEIAAAMPRRLAVSAETIRAWLRSGKFDQYELLVIDEADSEADVLAKFRKECNRLAAFPDSVPAEQSNG